MADWSPAVDGFGHYLARVGQAMDAWLASEFAGGSSAAKVEKMEEIDRRYHPQGVGN